MREDERPVAESGDPKHDQLARDQSKPDRQVPDEPEFVPPERHRAADRAGKGLITLAGSINEVLDEHDEPVMLDRKGPHVSIQGLEELIDNALDENSRA